MYASGSTKSIKVSEMRYCLQNRMTAVCSTRNKGKAEGLKMQAESAEKGECAIPMKFTFQRIFKALIMTTEVLS